MYRLTRHQKACLDLAKKLGFYGKSTEKKHWVMAPCGARKRAREKELIGYMRKGWSVVAAPLTY